MTFPGIGIVKEDDDYVAGGSGEVWIKSITKPRQRWRFLQPVGKFIRYNEHWVEGPGAFYCANSHVRKLEMIYEDPSSCPECVEIKRSSHDFEDFKERITKSRSQKRNLRFASNVLEAANGRLSVFKFGYQLVESLDHKEQLRGTIMDRDMTVTKTGTGFETKYAAEPEDAAPLKEWPSEIYDVQNAVGRQWVSAMDAYGFVIPADIVAGFQTLYQPGYFPRRLNETTVEHLRMGPPEDRPDAGRDAAGDDSALAKAADQAADAAGTDPTKWPVTQLKEFLTSNGVEFGDKAVKSRLERMVNDYMTEHPESVPTAPVEDLSEPPF